MTSPLSANSMRRVETVDGAHIRHVMSNVHGNSTEVPPPLQRGCSDLSHTRQSGQKEWLTNMKKNALSLSFKGNNLHSASKQTFEIKGGDLKIDKLLGEGCRSRVFAGSFKGRKVAVKQLRSFYDPDSAEKQSRLVHDLEVLSNDLRHPNIVQFLGVKLFRHERRVNLVFEHMGGGTLEEFYDGQCDAGQMHLIKRSLVMSWSVQLLRALQFLHERETPIIHRDLKPHNLLLSHDLKTLKLRDFGVSKTADLGITVFSRRSPKQEITTDLSQLAGPTSKGYTGTKRYMAPECVDGRYTTKADIYSAGLIMWLMLEGTRPWESKHGHSAFLIAKSGQRPPLRTDGQRYPAAMAELIGACWAEAASRRPEAGEVLGRLEALCEEGAVPPATSTSCLRLRSMRG